MVAQRFRAIAAWHVGCCGTRPVDAESAGWSQRRRRGQGNNATKEEAHDMRRTHALAMALGTVLIATAANAGLPQNDVPRAARGQETQAPRGEEIQAPRGH